MASSALYQALKAEGYRLPDGCTDVRLHMPADEVFQLEYRVIVVKDDLEKFGRALERVGKIQGGKAPCFMEGFRESQDSNAYS